MIWVILTFAPSATVSVKENGKETPATSLEPNAKSIVFCHKSPFHILTHMNQTEANRDTWVESETWMGGGDVQELALLVLRIKDSFTTCNGHEQALDSLNLNNLMEKISRWCGNDWTKQFLVLAVC